MENDDRLDRLTEREKVCLRHWLQHKSAKEIAVDLGISHHAVEKRLKMARSKLGATSSLEAARMLGKAEGYGQTVAQSPDLAPQALPIQTVFPRPLILGAIAMSLIAAALLALLMQPLGETSSVAQPAQATSSAAADAERKASTEAALRSLVAGVASGSPDYDKLAPPFAEIVRRDLPMTQPMFSSLGELKSMTFLERGVRGDDVYNLVFANGEVIMSAALDADGRMLGGLLRPLDPSASPAAPRSVPNAGTEAAVRSLVAGVTSGSPDYDKLAPPFAEIVRRDLPMTQAMFRGMGELKSMTFLERGPRGDDTYNLVFTNGELIMSAALDAEGKMAGGIIRPAGTPQP